MILAAPLYSEEFVGRRDELAFLHEEFRAACEGRTRFVAIEGEAGIGKSRLLEEFFGSVRPQAVLCGTCSEQIRSPYLPFADVLRALNSRRAWAPHVEQKPEFFGAVAEAVRRQAARSPLIVAIEDLQWADGATLELLGFLVQRLGSVPALFLLTMRDGASAVPGLAAFRSAASRSRSALLQLRPLRRNDVRVLVRQTLQHRALHLPSQTILQIETLAEGNPLFAEELTRLALDNGELTLQTHVPVSVAAILSERLGPFDERERTALVHAAIIGQSFDLPMLASILGARVMDLLALMQRCVEHGLAIEDGQQPLRFRFRHALIRKALADRLVLALAAPLHVRIAQMLEALDEDAPRTAELAYHWSAARVADKARIWNERAAEQAWSVYAYRDAIRFYNEALRWDYPPGTARAAVYERLGTLHYIDGSGDEPALCFSRCRAEYESAGDEEGAARAIWLLADQHWVDARTVEALRAATQAADRARSLQDRRLLAGALLSMARFAGTLGDPQHALEHLEAASLLTGHMDGAMLASMHEVRGETLSTLGRAGPALRQLQAAAEIAVETASAELIAQIENNVALGACDLGELETATECHRRALKEADRTGLMWRVAYCSLGYARTLTLKGRLAEARDHVWSALETGVSTATFKTKAAAVGIPLGLMLNDRGLLDACAHEEALEFALQSGEIQRIASVSAAFAELRAEQGSQTEARALLAAALERIPHAHRSWDLFVAVALHGDDTDVDRARRLLAKALGRPRVRRAYTLLFEALAARVPDAAAVQRLGRTAAQHFAAIGDRLHWAQSLEAAGERNAALQTYESMGSLRDAARLQHVVQRRGPDLTPRQLQIAHLVAQGETNRVIAGRLHISEHTVEHHVSAIFARLNLKSRAQLAHVMALTQGS